MSERNDIATRSALLKYYSSECLSHSGYIFTLVLIVLGLFEISFRVSDSFIKAIFQSIAISTFAVLGCYLGLRTLWWGYLANAAVHTRQHLGKEDFASLHQKCVNYVRGKGEREGKNTIGEKIASVSDYKPKILWVFLWGLALWVSPSLLKLPF